MVKRVSAKQKNAFQKVVWDYYKEHGRHALPWRKTRNPYRILVSEVMLQQTQVERVIPYYQAFLRAFPTPKKLAEAPLKEVLSLWQGLGYNRRAKFLQLAAREVVTTWKRFPKEVAAIERLPGVGPYTARAVAAFAYGVDTVFVETNIRTVIIHHFFKNDRTVSDASISELLEKLRPKGDARTWNAALMDYGSALKRAGVRTNAKGKGYTKQKPFVGSLRQARGAALRALTKGPCAKALLLNALGKERRAQMEKAIAGLLKNELIVQKGTQLAIA